MRVILKNKIKELKTTQLFGAEGEIYLLKDSDRSSCIKIYDFHKRIPYLEKKVLSLIQRFNQLDLGELENQIAYPKALVYDIENRRFCGYLMKYFDDHEQISKFTYNLNTFTFGESSKNDRFFLEVIDNLFRYLKTIHKAGIILGDLNPQNILVADNLKPAIVDVDSAQIGTFHSNSQRKEYKDPRVQIDGIGFSKYFIYSTDSDIFSLSIIAYELIVGSNPYYFQTEPSTESYFKKEKGISFFHYLFNDGKTEIESFKIVKNGFYFAVRDRIRILEILFPELIQYFKEVFIDNKRTYLVLRERNEISIKSRKFEHIDGLENIISYSKNDPEELEQFLNQFKISL